jgi:uncharacterized protein YkwD
MPLRLALLLLCLLAGSIATPARADEAFDAVAQARRQCAASAPALREDPKLRDAAARLARGSALKSALDASGYRAQRSVEWRLTGTSSPQAVTQYLVRSQCGSLRDPALTDAGVVRNGGNYWIVAAVPFAPPPQADAAGVASRVLALVNEARAQPRRCGSESFQPAGPLKLDPALTRAAAVQADAMAAGSFLEHQGRDGSTPADRATRAGYNWRSVGENIAMGQTTPERVVQDWLKSPEHCANIMAPVFQDMGIAFAVRPSSEGGIYWAQTFGRTR